VCNWFNEHGSWLIILNNADDAEIFFSNSEASKPLYSYIPHSSTGSIIITSRDRRVGERLAGRENCTTVTAPHKEEAEELLRSKVAPYAWSPKLGSILVKALENLPLAISQAAAFINENALTLDEYYGAFKADDSELVELLNEDSGDIRRDFENGNSVIKTWKLSFDQVRLISFRCC
jgi:hypothetical protein